MVQLSYTSAPRADRPKWHKRSYVSAPRVDRPKWCKSSHTGAPRADQSKWCKRSHYKCATDRSTQMLQTLLDPNNANVPMHVGVICTPRAHWDDSGGRTWTSNPFPTSQRVSCVDATGLGALPCEKVRGASPLGLRKRSGNNWDYSGRRRRLR